MANKKHFNKKINLFFIVILSLVFIFSVAQIIHIEWGYYTAKQLYLQAADEYVTEEEKEGEAGFSVDFAALKAVNPEICGWLVVDGTEISYPIVRGEDNEKYLKTAFDGSVSNNGSIFMNCYNAPDFSDQHTLIYGHHMRNGSMFGKLHDFKDPEYLKSHRNFHIYTESGVLNYEIFSAFVTYSASFVYTDHFEYSWDFYDFAQKSAESSIVDLGVELGEDDRIVTLSTCNSRGNRSERFVVMGKYLKDEESIPEVTAAAPQPDVPTDGSAAVEPSQQ